ncbi:LacI family DNA-binding transcriptional regulator [Humibacter albus]|uniref:LacI family DNA-binding transcriptional regulator n=1 Tax=Humibacter albus TaxID=427754 RepID=UPI0003B664D3|nr:LacI family DNA-binding transcriptional regulator [Humibacter albus]
MSETGDAVPGAATARPHGARPAPTIYDIAQVAGVNPSTVSRALSKPGRLNAKTEKRIQDAAKQLGYRANPMARALPTGRTHTLGLILADITNPVFFDVVRGAERAAANAGYTLLVAESQESGEREAAATERVAPSVDGIVLGATRLGDDQIRALAETKPVVVINRAVSGVDDIVPDLATGIDEALDHLAELGHTALAYLSGPSQSWMSRARWQLLIERAAARGMTIVEIGPSSPTIEGGREVFARVATSGVTAVLAYNDLMAIGVLRAAREQKVDVPRSLSVVGFDDIFGSDFTSPALTTVRSPLDLVGEFAVQRVLDRVEAREGTAGEGGATLSTTLVVRDSTGPTGK